PHLRDLVRYQHGRPHFAPIFTACRVQTWSLAGVWLRPTEARKHFGETRINACVELLAVRQVLHTARASLDVTVARDQSDRGARAVRGSHRALDAAAALGQVHAHTGCASPCACA